MGSQNDFLDVEEPVEDSFGFSFVDMVSGGFGAAFFMFLVFVNLPLDAGNPGGGGERFLQIWLTWPDMTESYEPIVEYLPPGNVKGQDPEWRLYRLSSDKLTQTGRDGEMTYYNASSRQFWSRILGAGFSDALEPALRDTLKLKDATRAGVWLHFADPCPGRYRFRVNRNAGFGDHLFSHDRAEGQGRWTLELEAPGLTGEKGELESNLVQSVETPSSAPDLDQFAPVLVLDGDAADPIDQQSHQVDEPIRKGSDLDHCDS